MKTAEYLEKSLETLNYDFNATDPTVQVLIHGQEGLVTEVGELLENIMNSQGGINFEEELGDIAWYIAIYMRWNPIIKAVFDTQYETLSLVQKSITPDRGFSRRGDSDNLLLACRLVIEVSKLADDFKRLVFYGKPPKSFGTGEYDKTNLLPYYTESIVSKMSNIIGLYLSICINSNVDPEKVNSMNIGKLRLRNKGNKFNQEAQFNRDTEAEAKVMQEVKDKTNEEK